MKKSSTIKDYWETRSPGLKHSKKEVGSKQFFDEIERERYENIFNYSYLPEVAEFKSFFGKNVLEVGIGLGTDILQYAKYGAKVHGIDLTNNAVELVKRRFQQEELSGEFQSANFTNLPYTEASMDLIYSFGVLHHSEETQQGIDEIYRVLKPGGKCIIMLYHKGFKYYVRKLFYYGVIKGEYLKYSSQEIINRRSEEFHHCPLTKAYTRSEAKKMFQRFDNLSMQVFRLDDYFYWNKRRISPSMRLLGNSLYRWLANRCGWNLIIKGTKPGGK